MYTPEGSPKYADRAPAQIHAVKATATKTSPATYN